MYGFFLSVSFSFFFFLSAAAGSNMLMEVKDQSFGKFSRAYI